MITLTNQEINCCSGAKSSNHAVYYCFTKKGPNTVEKVLFIRPEDPALEKKINNDKTICPYGGSMFDVLSLLIHDDDSFYLKEKLRKALKNSECCDFEEVYDDHYDLEEVYD